jgi:hypothetical protein
MWPKLTYVTNPHLFGGKSKNRVVACNKKTTSKRPKPINPTIVPNSYNIKGTLM